MHRPRHSAWFSPTRLRASIAIPSIFYSRSHVSWGLLGFIIAGKKWRMAFPFWESLELPSFNRNAIAIQEIPPWQDQGGRSLLWSGAFANPQFVLGTPGLMCPFAGAHKLTFWESKTGFGISATWSRWGFCVVDRWEFEGRMKIFVRLLDRRNAIDDRKSIWAWTRSRFLDMLNDASHPFTRGKFPFPRSSFWTAGRRYSRSTIFLLKPDW